MDSRRLTLWRRAPEAVDEADPQVDVVRWSELLRSNVLALSALALVGIVAVARDPLPGGVPLSAVYLVVNGWFAIRATRRDLARLRRAVGFRHGVLVRIEEPEALWKRIAPLAAVFALCDVLWGVAAAGRLTLAYVLPLLAQAVITRRAVGRRERAGHDIYVTSTNVVAHPRAEPLGLAASP
jgi:hypothetical protein